MRLGLIHINMRPMSRPGDLVQAARAAEQAGFDSVWAGEHVVLPDPQVPPSPMAPQDPVLDSLLALTWAAAHTSTIRLATGIVILPQRNPVLLAKQVASLDVLSGGRFTLGIGVGYLEPEFRAVGADFAKRGAVTDEYLDALRALWYDEHPEFRGRFADFGGVDAYPRPVQQPIPLDRGRAHRPGLPAGRRPRPRLVRLRAHARPGRESLAGLAAAASQVARPAELGALEIRVTPRGRMTAERRPSSPRSACTASSCWRPRTLTAPPGPSRPAPRPWPACPELAWKSG